MAPEGLSIARETECLGSGRWVPVARWTSFQTVYLYIEKEWGKQLLDKNAFFKQDIFTGSRKEIYVSTSSSNTVSGGLMFL